MPFRHALTIPGWMDEPELEWLWRTASQMQSAVEIGCWCGRSTYAIAKGCPGPVYAVDHWKGVGGRARLNAFRKQVGCLPNVWTMQGESARVAKTFTETVDMVFIDGGHEYVEAALDIACWAPKCKRIVCGHDYSERAYPGVVKAVGEYFGSRGLVVSQPAGFIWVVELGR